MHFLFNSLQPYYDFLDILILNFLLKLNLNIIISILLKLQYLEVLAHQEYIVVKLATQLSFLLLIPKIME